MEQERNEQLEHWGIKGMRWGFRRYQNPDGSLTPAGKKRYNDEVESLKAENKKLDGQIRAKKAQEKAMARINKLKAQAEAKRQALREKEEAEKKAKEAEKKAKEEAEKKAKESEKNAKAEAEKLKREKEIQESLDKENAEMAKRKLEIARSGDVKKIAANAHLFSDKELADLKLRVENEAAIKAKIPESFGKKLLDKLVDQVVMPVAKDSANSWIKKLMDRRENEEKAAKEAAEKTRLERLMSTSGSELRKMIQDGKLSGTEIEYVTKKYKFLQKYDKLLDDDTPVETILVDDDEEDKD